ncbi:hypothetical protein CAPTEDRAFT_228435 [Capitella teleta]|uniref:Uncharacterized protein n=1 Tax=Capitella teleta TaxID=283909 RepID=R7VG39_CAPTE|nr:hypothetical protein CAPTEDRAFT_228435 [Capitella teleta]|eukprot:ELU14645.1 hypothetical protein CAPTEDRAFT_228435 [Capitella teleta]
MAKPITRSGNCGDFLDRSSAFKVHQYVAMDTDVLRNGSDSDDSGVSLRLNNDNVAVDLDFDEDLICGICATLRFHFGGLETHTKVDVTLSHGDIVVTEALSITGNTGVLPWRPQQCGEWRVILEPQDTCTFAPGLFKVDVEDNLPVLAFNEKDYWPVASAVDDASHVLYVAYSQHISTFDLNGNFINGLVDLQNGCYYDLLVCRNGQTLVASVSGFTAEDATKRFQEVHVYEMNGSKVDMKHVIGMENLKFSSPVLSIAKKSDEIFCIADTNSISEISADTGQELTRILLTDVGSLSRLAYTDRKYVMTDAASGHVRICETSGKFLSAFESSKSNGLMGLAVDEGGIILTSDCISGFVRAYNSSGHLVWSLDAEFSPLKWPTHIALCGKHMFVCDHGNKCLKKYRYR